MRVSWPTRPTLGRRPHVEVVVPCYNYGRFLPGCIDSIVRQPGVEVSVTIIDDASTDDSASIADKLASLHRQVRLVRNEVNLGAIATFNRGVGAADSDYVVLISADDFLADGALERATGLMDVRPRVGLVYGHARKFVDQPVPHRPFPTASWTTWHGEEWIRMHLRRSWNNIASPEAVVRTSVQHQVGLYDPQLPWGHDAEMWLRIAAVADVGHVNGVDQAYYRRHTASMTSGFDEARRVWERWRVYDSFLRSWARRQESEQWRGVVRRKLADEVLFDLLGAIEHGPVAEDAIDAAVDVARRIDPEVVQRGMWSDVEAHRAGVAPSTASALGRAALREMAHRANWPRWRRFRYFG